MKLVFAMLLLLILLCGCIGSMWTKDISTCSAFSDTVHAEHLLTRDVWLIKYKSDDTYSIADLDDKVAKRPDGFTGKTISRVKIGAKLKIDEVQLKKIYAGPIVVIAKGSLFMEESNKWIAFEYFWSHTTDIRRAPWEGDETPLVRQLVISENYKCQ
jgi:hypothetical protein